MSTNPKEEKRAPVHILGRAKASMARSGVPHYARNGVQSDYRTYEIYQRERVHESTEKIRPVQLISDDFARDPYPVLEILRENYPCYRDWLANSFWITRYDDVTSLFADEANFETRSKLWFYDREGYGRDLREALPVLEAQARAIDDNVAPLTEAIVGAIQGAGAQTKEVDLATEFAARLPMELLAKQLALPPEGFPEFVARYWRMQRGYQWEPKAFQDGLTAIDELAAYFRPLLEARRADPGDDLISAIAGLDLEDGPATAEDVVVTLLEADHETLHGALSNMWFLLLTHPDQLEQVKNERRLVKFAYLETLRHSAPVTTAKRFARHEVERFGRVLPIGGRLLLSAAAANRDPRVYKDPDSFIVGRKDLCQREPRGQYRADGLPAGIAFGFGRPSKHPAVPEDRPRSLYAITRDTAVTASNILLDRLPGLRLAPGATPGLRALRLGEMHTCWSLPAIW